MKFLPVVNTALLLVIVVLQWQMLQQQDSRVTELDLQYEQLSMQLDRLEAEQGLLAERLSEWHGESLEAKVEEAEAAVRDAEEQRQWEARLAAEDSERERQREERRAAVAAAAAARSEGR